MQQPAGYTVQKHAQLSTSHRFFLCFPVCVAFRIGVYGVFADSRFVFQLCAGVGGGGVMTSMRMRLVSSVSFVASCASSISHRFLRFFADSRLFAHASLDLHLSFSSGGVMTSMRMRLVSSVSFVALLLKRCRLLCEALVAASGCFTFETSTMQKTSSFEAFQTKLRN